IPAPGTILLEGTINTITLIATDDAGNVGECNFSIEVEERLSVNINPITDINITLYPNPAENNFKIQNNSSLVLRNIEIFDIRNRLIASYPIGLDGNAARYDVSKLAAGTYWVVIYAEGGKFIKRLLKE